MTKRERIERERRTLQLKVWQLAPSEVDDGPNPYSRNPLCAGFSSWQQAQAWRDELRNARRRRRAQDAGTK